MIKEESKIYLSGKMSNLSKEQYELNFSKAQMKLDMEGWGTVYNPVLIKEVVDNHPSYNNELLTYGDYLLADLGYLLECDAIYMLKGWEWSRGAKCEWAFAVATGKEIIYEG